MAKGNNITVVANTESTRKREGTISGALKPGTIVQIDVSAGIDDLGNFTYEAYDADADGARPIGPLFILLPSELKGDLATTAYADGDHCFVFVPEAGEEFNLILQDVAGTGDDHTIGEMLIVDKGTGKLIATTGTPESEPFMLLEDVTDPTADTLAHVIYTGY